MAQQSLRAMSEQWKRKPLFSVGAAKLRRMYPELLTLVLTIRQREPAYRTEKDRQRDGERKAPWMVMFEPPGSSCA